MAAQWYVSFNGDQKGPLSASELKRWLKDGRLARDSFVRQGLNGPWVPLRKAGLPPDFGQIVGATAVLAALAIAIEVCLLLWNDPLGAKVALIPLAVYLLGVLWLWPRRASKPPG